MRLFKGTADDYFDSAFATFPLPTRLFVGFAKRAVWLWTKLYWHWTCDGPNPLKRPVPAGAKGSVFVANHASMLDPALLMAMALRRGCTLRPLYKSELGESRFVTWFFSRVGAIPLKRGTADMKAIRRAVNALKRGENVLLFPEGTRIWDPHARPELHGGFSLIAQMADCAVVPVAIDGTELINPEKCHKICRPARVRVRFGEPIGVADVPGESRKEKAAALEGLAMGRVYEMRADLRREAGKD